jgi:predicted PurR-regulated permease PerM
MSDEQEERQEQSKNSRLLALFPSIGSLPSPASAVIGLGVVAFAGMVLVDALSLVLSVVFQGLGNVLTVLLLALISAYLLDPLIDRFERAGWNRSLGIVISLGSFLIFTGLAVLLLVPYVVTEVADLNENIDVYIAGFGAQLSSLEVWVNAKTGMALDLRFSSMSEKLPDLLDNLSAGDGAVGASSPVQALLKSASTFFGGAVGMAVTWALFPIFAFFFLRDFDELKKRLFGLIPFRWREDALSHYVVIDQKMAAFVRGQFILCSILAVLYALGLGVFTDIDLAILVGVLSGLLFVIPYLGTFFGVLAGTILAVLKFGADVEVLKVWAVFASVQFLEGTLLTPKIVGDSVGLHPVVVMLALVVGANLFGFLGILLAVPIAAILQVLLGTALRRYQATEWFQAGEGEAPGADQIP